MPGSYMRARLVDRIVTEFSHCALSPNGVPNPIRAVRADDGLASRRFAARLCALIIGQRRLQRRNAFCRDATQPLLIAANRRHLRDNAGYPTISGAPNTSAWPPA